MAQRYRSKQGAQNVDVVSVLLNPMVRQVQAQKKENLRREIQEKESRENTFKPVTNVGKAKRAGTYPYTYTQSVEDKQRPKTNPKSSGDHNIDMYIKAQFKATVVKQEQPVKEPETYSFKPKVNRNIYYDRSEHATSSVTQIKGMDKIMARMAKGREEAEFKKKMTERSNFTAAMGVKKAKKLIKKGVVSSVPANGFSNAMDTKLKHHSGFSQIDGSQIVAERKALKHSSSSNKVQPLHLPKQQPKLKPSTIKDINSEFSNYSFKPAINKKPKRNAAQRKALEQQPMVQNFMHDNRAKNVVAKIPRQEPEE